MYLCTDLLMTGVARSVEKNTQLFWFDFTFNNHANEAGRPQFKPLTFLPAPFKVIKCSDKIDFKCEAVSLPWLALQFLLIEMLV